MSKKHLKRLKELQRLQALHQYAAESPVETPAEVAIVAPESTGVQTASTDITLDSHRVIKRDLIGLIILIVAMLLLLVALNWLIDHTALSQWIIKVAGFITS